MTLGIDDRMSPISRRIEQKGKGNLSCGRGRAGCHGQAPAGTLTADVVSPLKRNPAVRGQREISEKRREGRKTAICKCGLD